MIKIINYSNYDTVCVSLPLIFGEITASGDSELLIFNENYSLDSTVWPIVKGKFKVLVPLKKGQNRIKFLYKNSTFEFHLVYRPLDFKRFVKLVYIKCKDSDGCFQAPSNEDCSMFSACKRIVIAAKMLQTFTADRLMEHCPAKKTFCLEEDDDGKIPCHVFTSNLTLNEAQKLNEQELWSHFAIELMNSSLRNGNLCKFLAFLSFTRYSSSSNVLPKNHQEILKMTKGQVALGGGGLALFGSGCLHTWAEDIGQVAWRFGDKRKIDRRNFMDDSANRGYHWACYSTGLGSTLHELGHTFDLGHTKTGIMGRGFDDIYKYFIIDLFYYDHIFQQKYNPYYQASSVHNQVVPFALSPPASWKSSADATLRSLHIESSVASTLSVSPSDEKPWSLPTPIEDFDAVNIGKAQWTRSSAFMLYYHKWFNDYEENSTLSFDGMSIASSRELKVIDFRDAEGTSFHHCELQDRVQSVRLSELGLEQFLPEVDKEITFVALDSVGNLLKGMYRIEMPS